MSQSHLSECGLLLCFGSQMADSVTAANHGAMFSEMVTV